LSISCGNSPDFVAVVIHSYGHRFALVPGDPAVEATERLTERPPIQVQTEDDVIGLVETGYSLPSTPDEQREFSFRARRIERKAIDAHRFFIDMGSLRGWRLPEHRLRLAPVRRRHNRDSWHRGDRSEVRLDACL